MNTLHMVEIRPEIPALFRFLRDQGLPLREDADLGYGIHSWLAAAFVNYAPAPWRLFYDRRRPARILGYGRVRAEELTQRLREFADPSVVSVCPYPEHIATRPMPTWPMNRLLGFEVHCCPIGRKSRSGVEKDLFLIRADEFPDQEISREAVYTEWVKDQFEKSGAVTVTSISLSGFQLVKQIRRGGREGGTRTLQVIVRPSAILRGSLVVQDSDAFADLLARGIGRHRSFGYGMVLLRPPQ